MNIFGYTINKDLKFVRSNKNTSGELPDWKKDPAGFMVSIIKQQHSLYKKEIAHWQAARQAAFDIYHPRRNDWIELADEMMKTDAIIISETSKRMDRVLNKKFKIIDFATKKENEDKTDLFNKAWFYDLLRYKLQHIFYGHSLPYIKTMENGRITEVALLDRRHVVPEQRGWYADPNGMEFHSYLDEPFSGYCFPTGPDEWLGLLDAAAPLYILRKHSWANWDQFEEMFGIPLRTAKTTSTDPKVRSQISKWMRDLAFAGHALFPQDTELTIHENKQTDAFEVFNQKRKAANEELALLFNSQAETSNNSGSKAKAEVVVESTQEQTTLSDMRSLYFQINDEVMPILKKLGYPINPEMDVFQWDNPEDLKEKLEIFKGVSEMGFEVDAVQVEEVFNVKIVGKKQAVGPQAPLVPDQEGEQQKK